MVYQTDYEAVREAKDNLDQAIYDDQIGKLDDQIDDLNDQLDDTEKHYDDLIEDTEKFYDEQIEGIQKLIDKWEEFNNSIELAEALHTLSQFGISMEDILSGSEEAYNLLTSGFIAAENGLMHNAASLSEVFDVDTSTIQGYTDSLLGYSQSLGQIAQSAEDAANAIGGGSDGDTGSTPAVDNTGNTTNTTGKSDGSLKGSLDNVNKTDLTDVKDELNGEDESVKVSAEDATTAVNNPDDDGTTSLLPALNVLAENADEPLGHVTILFDEMYSKIDSCVSKVKELNESIEGSNGGQYSWEVRANPNTKWIMNGGGHARAMGQNQALVGELGSELVVDSRTGTWRTVGTNGAEFTKIKPSDIVFNHKQTEDLLKNGRINSRGKAYAYGKLPSGYSPLQSEELRKYQSLNTVQDITTKLEFGNQKLMNIDKNVAMMTNNVNTVNNTSNPVINVTNPTFTCTGVTGEEVLRQIESQFTGLFVNAYQRSMR